MKTLIFPKKTLCLLHSNFSYFFHAFLSLFLNLLFFSALAQDDSIPPKLRDINNPLLQEKALHVDEKGGVIYFCNCSLKKGELFSDYKEYSGLGEYDEMIELKTWQDDIPEQEEVLTPNFFHTQYQQQYKGIPVEGYLYTEHYMMDGSAECVYLTSGSLIEGLDLSVTPEIDKRDALLNAMGNIQSDSVEWDSTSGNLVIIYIGEDLIPLPTDFKLAYKFNLYALDIFYNKDVFVDAQTGDILKETSRVNGDGEFEHVYYGTRYDLDTYYKHSFLFADEYHTFANNIPGYKRNIYTSNGQIAPPPYTTSQSGKINQWDWSPSQMPYVEDTDVWGTAEHFWATSAHYCAQKAWDFYVDKYNHFGMTGKGGTYGKHIRVVADYYQTYSNGTGYQPLNNEDYICITKDNGYYLSTYDIVAHEFTHGVINRHSALPYEKASGAINEAFADIMGFMAEKHILGYIDNWTIGEDAFTIRSIDNPHAYGQPSYYLESGYWSDLSGCLPVADASDVNYNDNCGVHTNSGVINKWFYLLSMGGSQSVNGSMRSVFGIGADRAATLVYQTMTNYLNFEQPNLNFDKVKSSTLAEAAALWGLYSIEYYSVCRAWWAVNVGDNCATPFNPNISFCEWKPDSRITEFTGIKNIWNNNLVKVNIAPNPANSSILINLEEPNAPVNAEYVINIIDISGKTVFSQNYNNLINQTIDINNLNIGIYFVNIVGNNWVRNIKLIKK